ncbi:uncharacterized protein LOC131284755 [Anopheles ziemanni]|uniref:uncharacterized protein LOC131258752 n=1 Tax=Anopheles coustani TaxID=139045 RepID=UPI002659F9F9|nr:uncharacterized protein LOC131258752 [Anopheles coustani]XP_058169599.1 uncharacterized protein LOC131284755 [Anopheles ziemanni]
MDKFISMWKVRELADKVTNVVMNYTEIEGKVREATNDEPWGPTGPLMQELAHATFTYEHFPEVMSMLWKRMLQDNKTNWRRTYKSLLLLNYLVRNGSERVVTSSREHIYDLRSLENYTFVDENGKDQGINVRHKVRELIDFIQDDDRLREERKKAKKNKDKYIGMSSEAMGMRYGGSSGGGGGGGGMDYGGYRDSYDRRSEDRYNESSRDHHEYDYQYEGEREDSDNESNGPYDRSNRYQDREPSKSPATRQTSTTLSTGSTTAFGGGSGGTGGSERKINLNIKPTGSTAASTFPAPRAAATTGTAKVTKKIDLGAASGFAKTAALSAASGAPSDQLGINSPTHRNTHAEEIVGSGSGSGKQQEILEDLFKTCPTKPSASLVDEDDFNPRATEEFGDFESAFGGAPTVAGKVPSVAATPASAAPVKGDDFADFAAFGAGPQQTTQQPATSADLLFGLSVGTGTGMAGPQAGAPVDILSDLSGLSLGTGGATNASRSIEPGKRPSPFSLLRHRYNELIECVQNVNPQQPAITRESERQELNEKLTHLLECLPGPVQPSEVLYGTDARVRWDQFAMEAYSGLLETLVPLKAHLDDRLLHRIVRLDASAHFPLEAINILTQTATLDGSAGSSEVAINLLTTLLEDNTVLPAAFLHLSATERDDSKHSTDHSRQFIQLITSIPNRVANVLRKRTPSRFLPTPYSRLLCRQLLRALTTLGELIHFYGPPEVLERIEGTFLSSFLSKIITDFHQDRQSPVIRSILIVLLHGISSQSEPLGTFIRKVLHGLTPNALETVVYIALNNRINLLPLFREPLAANWSYVLLQKVPLYNYYSDAAGEVIGQELITLLAGLDENLAGNGERRQTVETTSLLGRLAEQLLVVWSSRTAIQRTSFEQHLYVTKLLLRAMKKRCDISRRGNMAETQENIRRLLFDGLRAHLESPIKEMRCTGMITAELIMGWVDAERANDDEGNRLRFDYAGFDEGTLALIDSLKNIDSAGKHDNDGQQKETINKAVEELLEENSSVEALVVKVMESNTVVRQAKRTDKLEQQDSDDDDTERPEPQSPLDSDDDDLPVYDMSNDTDLDVERYRPKYLLDLRDALIETDFKQDPKCFELAVDTAPDLIAQQLPNNDPKLALDLLDIFLSLEAKTHMPTFNERKFAALVEICVTFPRESGVWLCGQFHAEVSRHSVNRRILMLDVMTEAAKVLSNNRKATDAPGSTPALVMPSGDKNRLLGMFRDEAERRARREEAERIVRERIERKTRRFRSANTRQQENPSAPAIANRYADAAGWFFFPLLRGFGGGRFLFTAGLRFPYDAENLLLVSFMQALSVLMVCAENCPIGVRMASQLFALGKLLRFNEEPKVRLSVLQLVAAVFLAVRAETLRVQFYQELLELREWLEECTQQDVVKRGETNEECRQLARNVLAMCYGVLIEEQDQLDRRERL